MENTVTLKKAKANEKTRQLIAVISGTAAQFILAALLHFAYDATGGNTFVAVFASCNESVWEHIKILLIPYLLWSFAEYYIIRPDFKRFIIGRCSGSISLILLTICFFFVYSGVWGSSVLWIDIASALCWLLCAELSCVRVLNTAHCSRELFPIAAAVLCLIVVMLLCFTVSPPKIGLFRDNVTGLYGLEYRP